MLRHTRREFLRRAALLAALPFYPEPPVTRRPNILVILSDDQPFYTQEYMPKTNAWLKPGIEFFRAYVASPLCSPSRASIHTGLYPHNVGVTQNAGAAPLFNKRDMHLRTFGNILASEAGYECGYFGKWMNNYENIPAFEAPGYKSRRGGAVTWAATLGNRNPVRANVDGVVKKTNQPRHYETRWFGQLARSFIQANEAEQAKSADAPPWLCFASIKAPHSPYDPSPGNAGTLAGLQLPGRANFRHADPNKPDWVRAQPDDHTDSELRTVYQGKREEMLDLDTAIDLLCATVNFETTYVFFLTDNGFHLGEHGLYAKGGPYEEGSRTPFLVRGPAVAENATSGLLVSALDIAPTVLEIAGLDPGPEGSNMDGRSLLGPMVGAENVGWRERLLVEMPDGLIGGTPPWHAIRTDDRLYAEYRSGERELYDMDPESPTYDPYQTRTLHADPDRVGEVADLSQKLAPLNGASGTALRDAEAAT